MTNGLANNILLPVRDTLSCFFHGYVLARIIIFERDPKAFGLFSLLFNFFLTAEAVMSASKINQPVCIFLIHRQTFRLYIRAEISSDIRAFIVAQTNFL